MIDFNLTYFLVMGGIGLAVASPLMFAIAAPDSWISESNKEFIDAQIMKKPTKVATNKAPYINNSNSNVSSYQDADHRIRQLEKLVARLQDDLADHILLGGHVDEHQGQKRPIVNSDDSDRI